jgi:hypothetical protein
MNESEGLILLQLILVDVLLTSVLWYVWFKVTSTRRRLNDSGSEIRGTFYSLARRLVEPFKYISFSLAAYSFPFIFLWLTSLVMVPAAAGEVIATSWFPLLALLLIAFLIVRDMPQNEFDSETL